MHQFHRWILLAFILLGGALGAAAQEPDRAPIWDVLASAPDSAEARAWFSYVDYHAITGGTTDVDALPSALFDVASGPALNYLMVQLADQERLTGVPFLDVGQAATWSQPPGDTILLQGAFNRIAIGLVYRLRDFTSSKLNGLTLFCGPEGCDSGARMHLDALERGDPFGGHLGRQQPVLIIPLADDQSQLLSSASFDAVQLSAEAATGDGPSLADNPDYQAAVRAILAQGVLRQGHFLDAGAIGPAMPALDLTAVPQLPEELEPLLYYNLVAISESEDADGLLATVTLVYQRPEFAEAAAGALETRLGTYITLRRNEPLTGILEARGAAFSVTAFEDAETGLGVTQIAFTGPEDAHLYQLLMTSLYARDLGWLAL